MDANRIGEVAGVVWHQLGEKEMSLSELKKCGEATADEIVAAVGWLAREGKIRFETKGRRVLLSLQTSDVLC